MADPTIIAGVAMFVGSVLFFVAVILYARKLLVSSGDVTIEINDDPNKRVVVPAGGKLLQTLAGKGVFETLRRASELVLRRLSTPVMAER